MAPPKLTKAHKAAMAKGRRQARAVRNYLESLEQASRPGRRLSPDELQAKIHEYESQIADEDDPAARVELIQKRMDHEQQLAEAKDTTNPEEFESEFVEVVAEYSERKGITYPAWRELGVSAAVLRTGGLKRVQRPRT